MYQTKKPVKTTLKVNKAYQGESIEKKVFRISNNKEPIKDGAPLIYTDRKDGVQPGYNPRTDRFDVAIEAMDKVHGSEQAKREERHNPKEPAKIIDLPKSEGGGTAKAGE